MIDNRFAKRRAARKCPSETREQVVFVSWFRQTFPGVVIMSIRNDGYRTDAEKSTQLAMGLHPGASDLHIPAFDVWLEFKRQKGGVQSEDQKKFERYVTEELDETYLLCAGAADARAKVLAYLQESGYPVPEHNEFSETHLKLLGGVE